MHILDNLYFFDKDWYECIYWALALKNAILLYFTISKSHFIIYTIPFYNTFSIPNFYFSILLIKIIYLHNKIIYIKTQIKTKTQICNHLLPPPPQTTYPNRNRWPRHHPTAKIQTNETYLCHHNQRHHHGNNTPTTTMQRNPQKIKEKSIQNPH